MIMVKNVNYNSQDKICYTYLIGWSTYKKFYYGVRYSKNANPFELWKTYFTSSKYVKNFREKYGEPDIIQIRKTFNNPDKARLWEHKVLKKLKVVNDDKWLNQTDNISFSLEASLKGVSSKKPWKNPNDYRRDISRNNMKKMNRKYGIQYQDEEKRKIAIEKAVKTRSKFSKKNCLKFLVKEVKPQLYLLIKKIFLTTD